MSNLVTGIAFIVLLGGLVFVHELGHFLAAKFFNVKVLKFSLGFGPRVWGFRRGETEYQLAALPLGGFVKMAGENPAEEVSPEDRARSFSSQKPYRRAVIALAHDLGLKTAAEGIETEGQLQWLALQRCTEGQGHFISEPLPADEIRTLLETVEAIPLTPPQGRTQTG